MNLKLKHLIFTLFIPFIAFSQNEDRLIAEKRIYIYNHSKDTLKLSTVKNIGDFTFCLDTEVFKEISIGNSNERGIVFFSNCKAYTSRHGGMFDFSGEAKLTKYEIWNLKTKELLFEAINSYHFDFKGYYAYGLILAINKNGEVEKNTFGEGIYFYQYDFIIDENGRITIKNLESDLSGEVLYEFFFKPDNEEGVYEFVAGKYKKIETMN